MKTYLVKYRTAGKVFFRRIRKVTGDWTMQLPSGGAHARGFEREDGTRFEVPLEGTVFVFGPERQDIIRDNMAKETGQRV